MAQAFTIIVGLAKVTAFVALLLYLYRQRTRSLLGIVALAVCCFALEPFSILFAVPHRSVYVRCRCGCHW